MSLQSTDKVKSFHIEHLFGSKTRVRILTLFLEAPDRAYYVRELTRRIQAQLNSVRRELKNLVDLGIVEEVDGKILEVEPDLPEEEKAKGPEKRKFYRANAQFPFLQELRSIMKKSAVMMNYQFVKEIQESGEIHLLFLTGRFIDDESVPSDMLIVGKIEAPKLRQAIDRFEDEIGREINYTSMPPEEFKYRQEVKDRFLESLIQSDKIVLVNTVGEL